jgi:arginyl-tRNA synthetase
MLSMSYDLTEYRNINKILIESVKNAVKSVLDTEVESVLIEKPENPDFGDYSTNIAMVVAKTKHLNPNELARDVAEELQSYDFVFKNNSLTYSVFKKIEAVLPGFVNFHLSDDFLKFGMLAVNNEKETYGSSKIGNNKKVIIEFSQPNPNKPMHIGHARNNFLGSSLSEIFKFVGFDVVRTNYLNDWGTHICKSMLMYQKYGNGKEPDKKSDHFVGDFYMKYEHEEEQNPGLKEELAFLFIKMESGDPETLQLWEKIVGWAYQGWEQTYKDENVEFDVWMYQSNYKKTGKEIVQLALEKGIAEKDETSAIIARLEKYGIPDKVLLRKDGTSVYVTQDTQLAKDSFEKYQFDKRLYVVDNRQSDYFRQLFKIMELLGFEWANRLFHVGYGVVGLPEGGMSSRTGLVVNADDVFSKIIELEKKEIKTGIKSVSSINETAEKVALSAFRYGMLKVDSKQDIVFKYDQITKFDGNTGPYLMYTYARSRSVLEKAGGTGKILDLELLKGVKMGEKESITLRKIQEFPEVVIQSADRLSPHLMANYLYNLAQCFNSFYGEVPILDAEDTETKAFRLVLTESVAQVLTNGLKLLGIEVVEKM